MAMGGFWDSLVSSFFPASWQPVAAKKQVASYYPASWSTGTPTRVSSYNQLPAMGTPAARLPVQQMPSNATIKTASGVISKTNSQREQDIYNQRAKPFLPHFSKYSAQYGIPWGVLQYMAEKESSMQVNKNNGIAYGLMALRPFHFDGSRASQWYFAGKRYTAPKNKFNPYNAADSIEHSAWYLRHIYDMPNMKNWEKAIAGYNWGENNSAFKMANWKQRLPNETRNYVAYINGQSGVT